MTSLKIKPHEAVCYIVYVLEIGDGFSCIKLFENIEIEVVEKLTTVVSLSPVISKFTSTFKLFKDLFDKL